MDIAASKAFPESRLRRLMFLALTTN